jgi:uncharacterized membrane protein
MGTPSSSRLRSIGAFLLSNFGPLIAFYAVNYRFGLMPAIAASSLWSIAEVVRHLVSKTPLTMIFKFSAAMTVVFGLVDLLAQQSLLFKYEAVVTNIATAAVFGATLRGGKSIIQESYERSPRAQGRKMPEWLPRYFRAVTAVFVVYFLAKAVLYFFVARAYSIEQALAIRAVVGNVSLAVLFGLTFAMSKLFKPKQAPATASVAGSPDAA